MSFMRKVFPHAIILIANMYYVFFGIDRVNKAMNFIDNSITKTLLALMCLMLELCAIRICCVKRRRKMRGRIVCAAAAAILGGMYLALYVVDLIMGGETGLMLNEPVKYMILVMSLCMTVFSVMEIARQRRLIRKQMNKTRQRACAAA